MPFHRANFHLEVVITLGALLIAACGPPQADGPEASGGTSDRTADESDLAVGAGDAGENWQVLFDGESLDGWRGFRADDIPEGWTLSDDGALHFTSSEGDINQGLITEDQYADFDLRFEWRVAPAGNSGVFFHVTEEEDAIWKTGPEYQIVDNEGHPDGANPLAAAGANYGLYGPVENFANAAGEYNDGRIVVRGGHVEHFLNGHQIVKYDLGSEEWDDLVSESSFGDLTAYGRSGSGHIALQEGGPVWYRNIRIRPLDRVE